MSASTERKNRAAARAAGTDKKMLAAQEAEQKARKSKRKWILGTVAVLLCIALVLFLSSPALYRITTAVSVGDKNYSPAQIKFIRANSKNSLNFGGYTVNYDTVTQYFGEEYAQEMLESTILSQAMRNTVLTKYAQENGISLNAYEKQLAADSASNQIAAMRAAAKYYNVSLATYMSNVYGAGVNEKLIRSSLEEDALSNKALFSKYCSLSYTPEELAAYYEDPSDADLFSYVLFQVKADENRTAEEARAAAEAIVASFTDGWDEAVEPDVALTDIIAEDFPEETPSARTGVLASSLDENIRPWLSEEGRAKGDITAMEAADGSGWNVLLFLDHNDNTEPVVAVRHILIKAVADEDGNYTDEAKAAAEAKANEILDAFNQADMSEADFAVLAYLLSEDTGSSSNGGLYSTVQKGQMVEEFDAFCFDESRQYGDTAVVYGESASYAGYHVMFFVEKLPARDASARDALRSGALSDWSSQISEGIEPVKHWAYKLAD